MYVLGPNIVFTMCFGCFCEKSYGLEFKLNRPITLCNIGIRIWFFVVGNVSMIAAGCFESDSFN